MSNFKRDIKKSTDFYERNQKVILSNFNEFCSLYSIELDSKEIASLFDKYAGIDYILVDKKTGKMFGVAARVNFWYKTKGSLTIRYKRKSGYPTEYEKRVSSISKNDSFYPHITIQIDDNSGTVGGGIIVQTNALYNYIEKNKDYFISQFMATCSEGNQYLSIPYYLIKNCGIKSKIVAA